MMKSRKGLGVCAMALVVVWLVAVVPHVSARKAGAPDAACADWTPQHGGSTAMTSASPYSITFTPANFTAGGSAITVTVNTNSGAAFKGVLLTAQYSESCVNQNAMPGTFTTLPALTKLACNNGAVTHSAVNSQTSLTFQWTPPAISEGHIHFRATFVRSYSQFWVNVKSNVLVDSALGAGQTSCTSQPAAPAGIIQKDPECGKTRGCYSDCSGSDCTFLMTWAAGTMADNVLITLKGKVGTASNRYIAFGLSNDMKMGADSVHYCINEPTGVYSSYNDGKSNKQLANPKEGVSNIVVSLQDGVLTCTFTRSKAADSSGRLFALDKAYTLFWADGPGSSFGAGKHNAIPLISTQAVSLQDFTVDIGGGSGFPLVKAHGSLMVAAWICFASLGIVLARYFKTEWEDNRWFGEKIWFQLHRTCMVLCLLASASAFVIIFVEVDGYSEIEGEGYKKAHPVMGIIVMILTVANPIMALLRPHPGTKNRPIFNWLHWGVGIVAYTLAVITVFFGMKLGKAGAPEYTTYILAAFVAWHALVQITMEVIQCRGRNAGATDKYEMTDVTQPSSNAKSPSQSNMLKKVVLVIHFIVTLAFTITIIAVLNRGEDDDDD